MEPTRVTVDEVTERMDRGEQLAFVDTRNPQAWGEAESRACYELLTVVSSGACAADLTPAT